MSYRATLENPESRRESKANSRDRKKKQGEHRLKEDARKKKKRGHLFCDFKNCRILRFVCIVLYLKCPPWTHVLKVWTPAKWCILEKLSSL